MRITTYNANGICTAARKGMGEWIASTKADVLLLQEMRALEEPVAPFIGEGYKTTPWPCKIKGRTGVAVVVCEGIETGAVVRGVGDDQPSADTGRQLEVELPELDLRVVSAHLYSGDFSSKEKMDAKYTHLDLIEKRPAKLSEGGGRFLVTGDFNIARTSLDITSWKSNYNRASGVLGEEIAYLDRWSGQVGLVDVQRRLDPDSQGFYIWWLQRGKAFDNNTGWRIDYHLASPSLAEKVDAYRIDRVPSYDVGFSDYVPLIVDYTL